jgi:hypothetical protein
MMTVSPVFADKDPIPVVVGTQPLLTMPRSLMVPLGMTIGRLHSNIPFKSWTQP